MTSLFDSVPLSRGPALINRFMLSPLTNHQSNADGTLSDGEHKWLEMRANGGFGLVMTCASHVQKVGQGFPGQLGCFGDQHIAGLTRIADTIRASGKVSYVQLHHAGNRSPKDLIGEAPVCPSDDESTGARELTHAEVEQLIADFVAAAVRCDKAGFDGVEIHGAHGYIICQFLSSDINKRTDEFGGSLENRARVLMRIVDGVREQNGSTKTMIFGVKQIVAYVSQCITLNPGDVIFTGTPPGVGLGKKPTPIFLKAGQTMKLGIAGLGEQTQKLVASA